MLELMHMHAGSGVRFEVQKRRLSALQSAVVQLQQQCQQLQEKNGKARCETSSNPSLLSPACCLTHFGRTRQRMGGAEVRMGRRGMIQQGNRPCLVCLAIRTPANAIVRVTAWKPFPLKGGVTSVWMSHILTHRAADVLVFVSDQPSFPVSVTAEDNSPKQTPSVHIQV